MKKLTMYKINDGLDGVILAKSLKQAIKMLAPYYGYTVKDFIDSIKKCDKDYSYDDDWILTNVDKVAKKGRNRRSKMLGWTE